MGASVSLKPVAGVLAAMLALSALLVWQRGDGTAGSPGVPAAPSNRTTIPAEVDASSLSHSGPLAVPGELPDPIASPSDARQSLALGISVVDVERRPIEGALVSLTDVDAAGSEGAEIPDIPGWEALLERTEWATTDSEGRVIPSDSSSQPRTEPYIAWITHPDFHGDYAIVDPSKEPVERVVELSSASAITVRVLDGEGARGVGISVYQKGSTIAELRNLGFRGDLPGGDANTTGGLDLALGSFIRKSVTGVDGELRMSRLLVPTTLIAADDESQSEIDLASETRDEIVLQTQPKRTARGTVAAPTSIPPQTQMAVECWWESGLRRESLFLTQVRRDLSWGPIGIPTRRTGILRFRLSGGNVIPVEVTRTPASEPGEIYVELLAVLGKAQSAHVEDQAGAPIEGARVEVIWKTGTGVGRAIGWSSHDGSASVSGCPQTNCEARASKPGYEEFRQPNLYVVTPDILEVVLGRAGQISGIVTYEGSPVEEFQVYSWTDDPGNAQMHSVPRNEEGRFLLETVPLGVVSLIASSAEHPGGKPVTLELEEGVPREVLLELEKGTDGYGQVVDAYTGAPLPQASVLLMSLYSGKTLGPRGTPTLVSSDGRFELDGVSPGSAEVVVECPGRVSVQSIGTSDSNGGVSFGVIPLAARQDLEVRLLGEAPFDTSNIWFKAEGAHPISYLPIEPSGHLLIPDVAPGIYDFQLVFDDGTLIEKRDDLKPGEDWLVQFEFGKGQPLDVQLVAPLGGELPDQLKISASFVSPRGEWVSRNIWVGQDGRARFDHLLGDTIFVSVAAGGWFNLLATQCVHLDQSGSQVVEIELTGRSLEISAIDAEGEALDQGLVTVNPVDPGILWVSFHHLSSTEPMIINGISLDELVVSVRHPVLGLAFKKFRMNDEGSTQVSIEVGRGLPLELRVRDVEGPVPAVRCMLIPMGVTTRGYQGETDVDGALRYDGCPPNLYTADLDRYGYWPVDHEFEFRGESTIELNLRRRGNFEATVFGADGAQVYGATVDLHSIEFDTPVSAWVESGKLSKSSAGLTSDVQGRVFAEGIPRGAYRWSVLRPDGTMLSGEFQVPPGATAREVILLEP
jgi:hypothetical protein